MPLSSGLGGKTSSFLPASRGWDVDKLGPCSGGRVMRAHVPDLDDDMSWISSLQTSNSSHGEKEMEYNSILMLYSTMP